MSAGPSVLVHTTSVAIGAAAAPFGGAVDGAVLLFGESGSGKSDVALRLIAMGAKLISDDQTALFARDGRLFAAAPSALHGRMEIRGVGITMMGTAGPAPVLLAVSLQAEADIPRMPEFRRYALPAALAIPNGPPLVTLLAFEASTPAKIAAAAASIAHGAFVAGAFSSSSGSFI
jgi:hypothetical protein